MINKHDERIVNLLPLVLVLVSNLVQNERIFMIIKEFLHWTTSSDTKSRVKAVNALCEAFVTGQFLSDEMHAAECSMALLLEDKSPDVRRSMATTLATSDVAPPMIINALAQDQIDVSAPVLAYSPLLSDNNLVDLIANGDFGRQYIIATRMHLSPSVCAALIEVGDKEAVLALMQNTDAHIARVSISRLADRFGHCGRVRSLLLERDDLPANTRHQLVEELGNTFANDAFVGALLGRERVKHVAKDACLHATLALAETAQGDDMLALVEHLRIAGKITPSFLVHTLCVGNVDFFATTIGKLSGKSPQRIRAILSDGQYSVVKALYHSAGLSSELSPVFVDATLMWRDASKREMGNHAADITEHLISKYASELHTDTPISELLMMLENIQFTQSCKAAKQYALSLKFDVAA